MEWTIYEFLDNRGDGVIEVWIKRERIPMSIKARLDVKLKLLQQAGPDLSPGLLVSLGGSIYKLRVCAMNVELRPMLCRGPFSNENEFTLLVGATERDLELVPRDAEERAKENRETLIADPSRRRIYEF